MKRLLILSVMIISLSFISLAESATWVHYATDIESNKLYYDSESITYPAKGIVTVWDKTIYSRVGRKSLEKNLGIKGAAIVEDKTLYELNCLTREFRFTNIMAFDSSGGIVDDINDKDSEWKAIPPESSMELLYKEICKQGRSNIPFSPGIPDIR
jgi:hypothetical protein